MGGGSLIEILFFAIVALLVLFRLFSVLGRRTGNESPPRSDAIKRDSSAADSSTSAADDQGKVVPLPSRDQSKRTNSSKSTSETSSEIAAEAEPEFDATVPEQARLGLIEIMRASPAFDLDDFVKGARSAFEMTVLAYAAGDRELLRSLLADEVFNDFGQAIDDREERAETLKTTFVSIDESVVDDAELQGKTAFITMRFVSSQINAIYDAQETLIDGDPKQVESIIDLWTFARNTDSRDPNWILVATASPS